MRQVLGSRIEFESDSRELLDLVDHAYGRLPAHAFKSRTPELRIRLELLAPGATRARGPGAEPEPLLLFSHGGTLSGTNRRSFVTIIPAQRAAIVAIDSAALEFPYHVRYELIEFAVYTLATRVQGLIPLHAAGVGRKHRGVLLMGDSGAGKSTVALHALLAGLDFLSEDSVFVEPVSLKATGVANFLHVQSDGLKWLGDSAHAQMLHTAPVIRRRSGVEKFELDVRRRPFVLAKSPPRLVALVFLSRQSAFRARLARPLPAAEVRRRLLKTQAYGAQQGGWDKFAVGATRLEAYELRRGSHPRQAVEFLDSIL
jgi:hypothetical protein